MDGALDASATAAYGRVVRPLDAIRAAIHQRRRGLAAAAAALATLAAITALRSPPPDPAGGEAATATTLHAGEVAVPVVLANPAVASAVTVGDVIDVVAMPDSTDERARVVAPRVRVLDRPGAAGFGATGSGVVLVAVPEPAALVLAAAADRTLSVIIRTR